MPLPLIRVPYLRIDHAQCSDRLRIFGDELRLTYRPRDDTSWVQDKFQRGVALVLKGTFHLTPQAQDLVDNEADAAVNVADVRRCVRDCPSLRVRRASLAARLDALNTEAGEIRRQEVVTDRVAARRDALLADPVTSRLGGLLGTTAPRIDLLSGLMLASVLEGVACLLWMLTLESSPLRESALVVPEPMPSAVVPVAAVTAETEPVVTRAAASHVDETANHESGLPSHDSTTHGRAPRDEPLTPLPDVGSPGDDVARLLRDIAAGRLRPTVAEIRRHLGCSQAKAATLRRQLAARHTAV